MLLLGLSQVHAAHRDFKGSRQIVLAKMRVDARTIHQSGIYGGPGAPSARHHVVLVDERSHAVTIEALHSKE